ncbi:MAG: putative negative regulator of RcsB-dependent stress response [Candidatus Pelagisphaera sp.]
MKNGSQSALELIYKASMNIRLLILSIVVLSLSMAGSAEVQTSKSEEANQAKAELNVLVKKITAKLKEGKRTATELATEFEEFDSLLAKYPDENNDTAQAEEKEAEPNRKWRNSCVSPRQNSISSGHPMKTSKRYRT